MGVYLLTALIYRESMTRTDARLSAERSFSFREFGSLAERAGWRNFGHRKFRFARQAIWLEPAGSWLQELRELKEGEKGGGAPLEGREY